MRSLGLGNELWSIAAAMLLAMSLVDPIFSQPAPLQTPVIPRHNEAAGQDGPPLPPAMRQKLDVVSAQEDLRRKIGIENWSPLFPLPVCDAGKCGALNRDGTFVVMPAYDWVDNFFEGRAVVRVRDRYSYLYGYVDDAGRVMWRPQFAVADRFSRGFAQIDVDGKSGLIDREGRVALWPQFGFAVPFTQDIFWVTEGREVRQGNNGRQKFLFDGVPFSVNGVTDTNIVPKGNWGLVDRSGAWIRRPEFLAIRVFDNTESRFMWAKTDTVWGLLRPDLSWQAQPRFEQVGPIHDGLAVVVLNHRWGFVDAAGGIVIEPQFDYAFYFSGPYAPVKMNGLFGLVGRTGAWVVEPKYDMLFPGGHLIPKSWWTFKVGEKYGLLDDSLREVIGPQLDSSSIAMCADGGIIGFIGRTRKLFSHNGTPIEDDHAGCESLISMGRK
jgi:WG repeat protein